MNSLSSGTKGLSNSGEDQPMRPNGPRGKLVFIFPANFRNFYYKKLVIYPSSRYKNESSTASTVVQGHKGFCRVLDFSKISLFHYGS